MESWLTNNISAVNNKKHFLTRMQCNVLSGGGGGGGLVNSGYRAVNDKPTKNYFQPYI